MLYDEFNTYKNFTGLEVFKNKATEKVEILKNLNPNFLAREYQKEALGRFYYYCEEYHNKQKPIHLLFNMATGSGKTMIMAANILYLYQKGYRNFIFFTRLGNIIQKTKDNFLNPESKKYLFADKILIGDKEVKIKEVENFEGVNDDDINICFATIGKLHRRFNSSVENSVTFEDFEDKKVVLIADEAHNFSAETRKTNYTKEELEDRNSWEKTVMGILNANKEKENVLLEFTATARLEQEYPEMLEKYKDKAIFRYDLKEYRLDGFSKDVRTISIDAPVLQRALTAVIVSQYRRKIAEKNKIALKPVVLFKANRVTPPKDEKETKGENPQIVVSGEFKEKFHKLISELKVNDLKELKKLDDKTLQQVFSFFDEQKINLSDLVDEIKNDFAIEKCLTVDDDKEIEKKQILLNSLEDNKNEIRAIFATEKLNEGWDVLNLFDIVRLYDTRDARENKPGKTTVAEAQLIGRSARYYPFVVNGLNDLYRRKFDADAQNELRILEQLFYYSANNPRYIQELTNVLVKEGIIASNKIEREIKVKDEFKEKDLWKKGFIFLNSRKENTGEHINSLADAQVRFDFNADWNIYKLMSGEFLEKDIFTGEQTVSKQTKKEIREFKLIDFGQNVIRSAMDRIPAFSFDRLSRVFGNLLSIKEFINKKDYLGDVRVKIEGTPKQLDNLSQDQKLKVSIFVLGRIVQEMDKHKSEFIGEKLFKAEPISKIFHDKKLQLDNDSHRAQEMQKLILNDKEWFAQNEIWGTREEESFIEFFNAVVGELKNKYSEIGLLRNEQHFKIYSFDEGLAFSPDFVLFLKEKKTKQEVVYQVFIEPKGDQFLDKDNTFELSQEGWKQKFLLDIEKNYKIDFKKENEQFKLIGLRFYNEGNRNPKLKEEFEDGFKEKL